MRYVELHCHSCFSFREGASSTLELVLQAKRLGYDALALTDHDNLAGAMEFGQTAKAWDLKAISGAEISLEDGSHLTLLAETAAGYANLCRLLTQANMSSPRGAPVVQSDWLLEHAAGLIALSGCSNGQLARAVDAGDLKLASQVAVHFRDVFGKDNFFFELQDNLTFADHPRIRALVALAGQLDLGYVATNNVHYHVRERHRLHDLLTAVRARQSIEEARPLLRPNSEFYLKSAPEMQTLFSELPLAIDSTGLIADRCVFDVTRDLSYQFPDYAAPGGQSADDFLHDLVYRLARPRYGRQFDNVVPRLEQELDLIRQGRRAGFFLRMWELMEYAHEKQLPVRGRGSSVGSVVCFLLSLSGIDPIKYELKVERFLNPARLEEDVPDIDLDFGRRARDEMFRTIFERYGTSHAAQVAAVIEYRYPSAVRDVGKAIGLPEGDVDKIAKRMHSRFAGSFAAELESMPEYQRRLNSPVWQDFARLVEELRGMPRHLSQHSGGIIISSTRMDEQVPVEPAAMDGRNICQWDKDSVADAGFVKLDLLGYPTLDQIQRALRYIEERHGKRVRPEDIDLTDARVYEMLQAGDSIGIVQIQSRAQIQLLQRIKVENIHDLIVQVALIRPGPIQGHSVSPYVARSLGMEPITYDHPSLEPSLAETKGVIVFQEQVLAAAMAIAGFSSGKAEQLRRAMSRKRSREAMEALKDDFLTGAAGQGIDQQIANTVYGKILAFAEFGFPKSHSAALAVTAYQAAWLKLYYPVEFYCALLNEQPLGFYSPEVLCNDARRHGLEVRQVDSNHSLAECTMEGGEAIRLGYRYVRGLGEETWKQLDSEAAEGPYTSLWDFWRRTGLKRSAIEALTQVGAFAWSGLHERELIWQLGTFYQPLTVQAPLALSFDTEQVPLREMSQDQRIVADLSISGIAVRGRSIDLVAEQLHEGITPSHLVQQMKHGVPVTVAGLVAVRQAPETAKGFVFHTLEDGTGLINIITNPRLVPKFRQLIESAPALIVHGHIERQERAVNVVAERFEMLAVAREAGRRVHNFG